MKEQTVILIRQINNFPFAVIRRLWNIGGKHGRIDVNDEHWQGNGGKADICWH